jgi:hypothetical protein
MTSPPTADVARAPRLHPHAAPAARHGHDGGRLHGARRDGSRCVVRSLAGGRCEILNERAKGTRKGGVILQCYFPIVFRRINGNAMRLMIQPPSYSAQGSGTGASAPPGAMGNEVQPPPPISEAT